MIKLTIATPGEMSELGARIARQLIAGDIVALDGELGAGKTTLTRGLGAALHVRGTVTSPTFVLARTHPRSPGEPPLVHVDAYRLGSPAELDDLDIDFAGSIVVVEWAAGMLEGVSDSVLEVSIARPMGGRREADVAGERRDRDGTAAGAAAPESDAAAAAEIDAGADIDTESGADSDDDEADSDGIEPRQVTIVPRGPRWQRHPFV